MQKRLNIRSMYNIPAASFNTKFDQNKNLLLAQTQAPYTE